MTPEKIVEIDAQKNKGGISFKQNLSSLHGMQSVGGQVLREGDTLYVFIPREGMSVEVHTFNAAPINQFIDNTKKFLRMLKKLGAKDVWTEFDDPKMKSLFEMFAPEFKFAFTKGKRYMAKAVLS